MKETIFKEKFKEAMTIKGLNQSKLAELMNVKQSTISRWLNGDREPDYKTLLILCGYLDIAPNDLLGYNESTLKDEVSSIFIQEILNDQDFKFLSNNAIIAMKREGKSEKEINEYINKIFHQKIEEWSKYFNFTPSEKYLNMTITNNKK